MTDANSKIASHFCKFCDPQKASDIQLFGRYFAFPGKYYCKSLIECLSLVYE